MLTKQFLYTKADEITTKIRTAIDEKRRSLLSKVDNRSAKQLWAAVKPQAGQSRLFNQYSSIGAEIFINAYFAYIRTRAMIEPRLLIS